MAITINGSGITSANIADGAIVNADVSDLAASKLTGALPAISGASLTSLTSSQVDSGSTTAKAWVSFNGTGTVAIEASYNISSITDNGVGNYTANFTTATADAVYTLSGVSQINVNLATTAAGRTTTGVLIYTGVASSAAAYDGNPILVVIHGN